MKTIFCFLFVVLGVVLKGHKLYMQLIDQVFKGGIKCVHLDAYLRSICYKRDFMSLSDNFEADLILSLSRWIILILTKWQVR